jgi:hypothetical protein
METIQKDVNPCMWSILIDWLVEVSFCNIQKKIKIRISILFDYSIFIVFTFFSCAGFWRISSCSWYIIPDSLMGISLCTWSLRGGFFSASWTAFRAVRTTSWTAFRAVKTAVSWLFFRTAASWLLLGQQLASRTTSSLAS